jgi:dsDNA-specific endonuclease/ATPase MutS2
MRSSNKGEFKMALLSKEEAVRLLELKIKGEQHCYSSIVNEAVRMIREERKKVETLTEQLDISQGLHKKEFEKVEQLSKEVVFWRDIADS